MSNKIYNFFLPAYQKKFGKDWQGFTDILQENYDHYLGKALTLYHLLDLNRSPDNAVQRLSTSMDVPLADGDDPDTIRKKQRNYFAKYADKSLPEIYIAEANEVTGGPDGEFRPGTNIGWIWGTSHWAESPSSGSVEEIQWATVAATVHHFVVFFDAKTVDAGELDEIQTRFRRPDLRPGWNKIFIVDASDNILREI